MPKPIEEQKLSSRWDSLNHLWEIALVIILGSGLFAFSKDRLASLWPPMAGPEYLSLVLSIILLCAVIVLIFRWILATQGELRMLHIYFHEFIKPQPGQLYLWTISTSILLGILGAFSGHVLVFSIIFTIYTLLDLWAHWIRNRQINKALDQVSDNKYENDERRIAWKAIEEHYIKKPQVQVTVTIMFFSFISVFLAYAALYQEDATIGAWLKCGAYLVLIILISANELVLARWRRQRDHLLGDRFSY